VLLLLLTISCGNNDSLKIQNINVKESTKMENGFYEVLLNNKFISFLEVNGEEGTYNDFNFYLGYKEDSVQLIESYKSGECVVKLQKSNYHLRKILNKENKLDYYHAISRNGNDQKIRKINLESNTANLWSNLIKIAPKSNNELVDSILIIANSVLYWHYTDSAIEKDKSLEILRHIPKDVFELNCSLISKYLFNSIIKKTDSISEFKYISRIENNNCYLEVQTFYNPKTTQKIVDSSETFQNDAINTLVINLLNFKN
jgi:ribosomal protein S8